MKSQLHRHVLLLGLILLFPLIGLSQVISISSPADFDALDIGSDITIIWSADGFSDPADIIDVSYSSNGTGGPFDVSIYNGAASGVGDENGGSVNWTVVGPVSFDAAIKVENITFPASATIQGLLVIEGAPSLQASNISFSNITSTAAEIDWTNGNGAERIVFMQQIDLGSAVFPNPADGQFFSSPSTTYGAGDLFNGWYVMSVGDISSPLNVNGLSDGLEYTVAVLEYNASSGPGSERYNVDLETDNPNSFGGSCDPPSIVTTISDNTSCSTPNGQIDFDVTSDVVPPGGYEVNIYAGASLDPGNEIYQELNLADADPATVVNLNDGTYTIQAINNDTSCEEVIQVTVNDATTAPTINAPGATISDPSTFGGNDGVIDASGVVGVAADYQFQWFFGTDTSTPLVDFSDPGNGSNPDGATTEVVSGLAAGDYTLTITEIATGCVSLPETFTLTDPAEPGGPVTEDFEDLPASFSDGIVSLATGDWNITGGSREESNVNSPTHALFLSSGANGTLISPPIDGDNTTVSFFHAASGGEVNIEVFKSVDGGADISVGTPTINAPYEEFTVALDEGPVVLLKLKL